MSLTRRADQPARTRLIIAQAEKVERFNRVEAGELVRAADVTAEWADIAVMIRSRLMAIPARIAARYPGTPPRLIAELERELVLALNTLADDL